MSSQDRPAILVISHDTVGPVMAGPGVRYTGIARALRNHLLVRLAAPYGSASPSEDLDIVLYDPGDGSILERLVAAADAVLLCGDTLASFPALLGCDKPIIVDGYDPHTVESLFLNAQLSLEEQVARYQHRLSVMRMQCMAGDFFICASEIQRDWWLGHLESNGRVNPYTLHEDRSLRRLIDLVPVGLPSQPFPPEAIGTGGQLAEGEQGILWGGGLWEWLDPVTAVAAMPQILAQEPGARLLFPGTRHPNPGVPEMPKVVECEALAQELGLHGNQVRFGATWVPRTDWIGYLAGASVGLSLHPDTIEAHLAFRSRILDYVWAGLPMVVTKGDVTGELVRQYDLGIVVDHEDTAGVAHAVLTVLRTPKSDFAEGFARARADLTWERVTEPLVAFCERPRRAPDKGVSGGMDGASHRGQVQRLEEERDQLAALVEGYESGRFIRTMNRLHRLFGRGGSR